MPNNKVILSVLLNTNLVDLQKQSLLERFKHRFNILDGTWAILAASEYSV